MLTANVRCHQMIAHVDACQAKLTASSVALWLDPAGLSAKRVHVKAAIYSYSYILHARYILLYVHMA